MQIHAAPHRIEDESIYLDGYARRGIVLDRDSAHIVIAALERDAFEMERRGGEPNIKGAQRNQEIKKAIGLALSD